MIPSSVIADGTRLVDVQPDLASLTEALPDSSSESESRIRARAFIRGWYEVLTHHRCPQDVLLDVEMQLLQYLDVSSETCFFKRAKYVGPFMFAWYIRADLPSAPDLPFVFTGKFRRWARSRRYLSRSNTHLWYSILQGKRAALPVGNETVLKTYQSHAVAMEKPDPLADNDDLFNELVAILEPILGPIRDSLTEDYRTDPSLDILSEPKWTPSVNASFEASKSSGGQQGAVLYQAFNHLCDVADGNVKAALGAVKKAEKTLAEFDILYDLDDLPELSNEDDIDEVRRDLNKASKALEDLESADAPRRMFEGLRSRELTGMQFYHRCVVNGSVRTNVVVEFYDEATAQEAWGEVLTDLILNLDTGRPLKCTIYGILEPLKVRVISKGEALPYYGSKELQKRLHGILRKMPCFRLIGRPLSPTDLIDAVKNCVGGDPSLCEWFSVDYSSATDCLSARLSSHILNTLIEGLPDRLKEVWVRVLAPHWCEYPPVCFDNTEAREQHKAGCRFCAAGRCNLLDMIPEEIEVQVEPVQQKNGQLMGSPLSFPILCLANLALVLRVLIDDPRTLKQKLSGVLINGDDALYVAPPALWDSHVSLGKQVGLEMTIGKAYHHPVMANANSTCFHMDLRKQVFSVAESGRRFLDLSRSDTPVQIDFLNTGLFFGQNKVMGRTDDSVGAITNCSSVINQLLKGALPGKQCLLLARYLSAHKEEIARECMGRNLFIPVQLGGMGAVAPAGWSWKATARQIQDATAKALKFGPYGSFGVGPHPSPVPVEFVPRKYQYDVPAEPDRAVRRNKAPDGVLLRRRMLEQVFSVVSSPVPGWTQNFIGVSGLPKRERRFSPSTGRPIYTDKRHPLQKQPAVQSLYTVGKDYIPATSSPYSLVREKLESIADALSSVISDLKPIPPPLAIPTMAKNPYSPFAEVIDPFTFVSDPDYVPAERWVPLRNLKGPLEFLEDRLNLREFERTHAVEDWAPLEAEPVYSDWYQPRLGSGGSLEQEPGVSRLERSIVDPTRLDGLDVHVGLAFRSDLPTVQELSRQPLVANIVVSEWYYIARLHEGLYDPLYPGDPKHYVMDVAWSVSGPPPVGIHRFGPVALVHGQWLQWTFPVGYVYRSYFWFPSAFYRESLFQDPSDSFPVPWFAFLEKYPFVLDLSFSDYDVDRSVPHWEEWASWYDLRVEAYRLQEEWEELVDRLLRFRRRLNNGGYGNPNLDLNWLGDDW